MASRANESGILCRTAGTEPGEHIHPEVAHVLEDLGLDTSRETPKLITQETIDASDIAITTGCGANCPWSPNTTFRDWPLGDPKGEDDATVRRIVADIDGRVRDLLVELVPDIELPHRCSTRGSVVGMAGQVRTRRPAKPCRMPAYDCCDGEDPAN